MQLHTCLESGVMDIAELGRCLACQRVSLPISTTRSLVETRPSSIPTHNATLVIFSCYTGVPSSDKFETGLEIAHHPQSPGGKEGG